MDTQWSVRFIAGMWKIALAAVGGFLITALTMAVGREVYFAFQARPAAELIGSSLSAIGSLRWVDTTLVTGIAAVGAASFSIYWVRRQIESASKDAQDQIDAADDLHRRQREAKLTGARAVLSVSLSAICAHADAVMDDLCPLWSGLGPDTPIYGNHPEFPPLPVDAVHHLRQVIELAPHEDIPIYSALVGKLQVHAARLRTLRKEIRAGSAKKSSLEDCAFLTAEVYCRSSLLFDYARFEADQPSGCVTVDAIGNAMYGMGIYQGLYEVVCRKAVHYFPYDPGYPSVDVSLG